LQIDLSGVFLSSQTGQKWPKTRFSPIMLTKMQKWSIFLWSHPADAKRVLKVKLQKPDLDIYFCPSKSEQKMRA
jgi:hypothetical protein